MEEININDDIFKLSKQEIKEHRDTISKTVLKDYAENYLFNKDEVKDLCVTVLVLSTVSTANALNEMTKGKLSEEINKVSINK